MAGGLALKDEDRITMTMLSSVIGHRSSAIGHRPSVIGHRPSVIGHRSSATGHRPSAIALAALGLLLAGCNEQDMVVQPKYRPFQESTFFADGQSSRPLVPGTVARGELRADRAFYTGKSGDKLIDTIPVKVTPGLLARGRERFEIYCSPCHDRAGTGRGMIVLRGFSPPPTLHQDRLRDAPAGHFYNVITNGYGAMYSYAARVAPDDRWAIVAYIRALQLSQHARLADLTPDDRAQLEGKGP
jgi:mono/diheme cytochrome c family protein